MHLLSMICIVAFSVCVVALVHIYTGYTACVLYLFSPKIGSPTALANQSVEDEVRGAAELGPNGLYVPVGAFWGAEDVKKMADRGTLKVS